jgi:hypothetical protein
MKPNSHIACRRLSHCIRCATCPSRCLTQNQTSRRSDASVAENSPDSRREMKLVTELFVVSTGAAADVAPGPDHGVQRPQSVLHTSTRHVPGPACCHCRVQLRRWVCAVGWPWVVGPETQQQHPPFLEPQTPGKRLARAALVTALLVARCTQRHRLLVGRLHPPLPRQARLEQPAGGRPPRHLWLPTDSRPPLARTRRAPRL